MRSNWFVFLLLMTGCGGARLVETEGDHLRETIRLTRWSFEGGPLLTVVADQGVGRYRLTPAGGSAWHLEWEHAAGGPIYGRTLEVGDTRIGMRPEPGHEDELAGTSWGSAFALLLQGNGALRLVVDEEDLTFRYGFNARAYLGLRLEGPDRVGNVLPGSPAAGAGFQVGDRLLRAQVGAESVELSEPIFLAQLLPRLRPGERVVFVVERGGESLDLNVELGERPLSLWNQTDG